MKKYLWVFIVFMANVSHAADPSVTGIVNVIAVTAVAGSVKVVGASSCVSGFNFNLQNDALFSVLNAAKVTSFSASPKTLTIFYDNDTDCNITHVSF